MAKNAFSLDVSNFIKSFDEGAEKTMRITSGKVFAAITKGSPVKEGRFRGAWMATGAKPSSRIGSQDKGGGATIERMQDVVLKLKDWSIFTYTNNMPQSLKIEYGLYPNPPKKGTWNKSKGAYEINTVNGYSTQAKNGVVRINIARSQLILEQEAKKYLPK